MALKEFVQKPTVSLQESLKHKHPEFQPHMVLGKTPVMIEVGLYLTGVYELPVGLKEKIRDQQVADKKLISGVIGIAFDDTYTIVAVIVLPSDLPPDVDRNYKTRWVARQQMVIKQLDTNPQPYLLS